MAAQKTSAEKVVSYLARRKTPTTVATIADKTGLTNDTVRSALRNLDGQVKFMGVEYTGSRGRPPRTYLLT